MRQGSVRVLWVGALGMLLFTGGGAALSSRAADWHPFWLVATLRSSAFSVIACTRAPAGCASRPV